MDDGVAVTPAPGWRVTVTALVGAGLAADPEKTGGGSPGSVAAGAVAPRCSSVAVGLGRPTYPADSVPHAAVSVAVSSAHPSAPAYRPRRPVTTSR